MAGRCRERLDPGRHQPGRGAGRRRRWTTGCWIMRCGGRVRRTASATCIAAGSSPRCRRWPARSSRLADAEGFLPDSEGAKGLTAGTILTVRVTRAAQGNKGPRLTASVDEEPAAGEHRRLDPPRARSGAAPRRALSRRAGPGGRCRRGGTLRLAGTASRVAPRRCSTRTSPTRSRRCRARCVELPGGARLSIWPTPALVAIDVDAGGALAGAAAARSRHEALNRAVLPALAGADQAAQPVGRRSSLIWPGCRARKRAALGPDFVAALANDPLHPRFLGFTALGLAEIVRSRVHPPLHELLAGPLGGGAGGTAGGDGGIRTGSRAACRRSGRTRRLSRRLQADPVALPDLVRRTGRGLHCDQTRRCRQRHGCWRRTMAKQPSTCPICGRRSSEATGRSARHGARRSISAAG